jgi:hypothetical protein
MSHHSPDGNNVVSETSMTFNQLTQLKDQEDFLNHTLFLCTIERAVLQLLTDRQ